MTRSWRIELLDVDMSETAQFEGRTAEEAVARARAALGDSCALRCWKTRRGGVGGFFAREVFVAGLTPPPGSEATRSKTSRARAGQKRRSPDHAPLEDAAPRDATRSVSTAGPVTFGMEGMTVGPEDHLFELVEATSDQVSLGSLAIPAEAFDEVLAEAQAALTREREGNAIAIPHATEEPGPLAVPTEEPGVSEQQPVHPHEGQDVRPGPHGEHAVSAKRAPSPGKERSVSARPAEKPARPAEKPARPAKKAARPAKKAGGPRPNAARTQPAPRPGPATTKGQRRPARIPDLRPGLRSLGVPDPYVPRGQRTSLDDLASVLATLPVPPELPGRAGAVVAVVGSDRNLERTVDLVATELSLGRRDLLRLGITPGAGAVGAAGATSADDQRLGRQIARRKACGRTSLLAVQAGPGMPLERGLRGFFEQKAPDYVLAAVDAGCKRVDVEHWIAELPHVDALALWDLSETRTPAELLGVLPIAYVEGEPSSALGWTLTLAARAMEHGGR